MTHLDPEMTNRPENIRNISSVLKSASGVVELQHDPTDYTSIVCFIIIKGIKNAIYFIYHHVCVSRICHFLSMEFRGKFSGVGSFLLWDPGLNSWKACTVSVFIHCAILPCWNERF